MSAPSLELCGVSKYFGRVRALDDIDLALEGGGICGLIGPNGAGKTTLLNVLTGQLWPEQGRVMVLGRDMTYAPVHVRARAGLGRSFQITSVFANMTVRQNMRCALLWSEGRRHGLWRNVTRDATLDRRIDQCLDTVGLIDKAGEPAGLLSYGEQRALELGLAIAPDSALLLLDEPTAGMNREETDAVMAMIRRIAGDRTVLIIEHDMELVFNLCDRIVVLAGGRIIADGPPDTIRGNPAVRQAYFADAP